MERRGGRDAVRLEPVPFLEAAERLLGGPIEHGARGRSGGQVARRREPRAERGDARATRPAAQRGPRRHVSPASLVVDLPVARERVAEPGVAQVLRRQARERLLDAMRPEGAREGRDEVHAASGQVPIRG